MLEIKPLGDADLLGHAGVLIAAEPVDAPDDPVPSEEQVAGWLRAPVQITVRPEHRRQGNAGEHWAIAHRFRSATCSWRSG